MRLRRLIGSHAGLLCLIGYLGFLGVTIVPLPRTTPLATSQVTTLGRAGVGVRLPSLICSGLDSPLLDDEIFVAGHFAIRSTLRTDKTDLEGPARVFGYSSGPAEQNWMVGQERRNLAFRYRGREVIFEDVFRPGEVQNLVVSVRSHEVGLWVDGRHHSGQELHHPPNPWKRDSRFVIGNEVTGDRPWSGEVISLVLRGTMIDTEEGLPHADRYPPEITLRASDLRHIELRARDGRSVPLRVESWPWRYKLAQNARPQSWAGGGSIQDILLNFIGTIPLGFLLTALLSRYESGERHVVLVVVAIQGVVTLVVESLQLVSIGRHADLADIVLNCAGAAIGAKLWIRGRR